MPQDYGYGQRYNSTQQKGLGFLGPLKMPNGGTTSEFSIGVNIGGKEVEIPTFVPTLTKDEVQQLIGVATNGGKVPAAIVRKAITHATQRITAGQDPFAGPGEQQMLHPDIPRQWPEPNVNPPSAIGNVGDMLAKNAV